MARLARICVFCGSSPGRLPAYAEVARGFGAELAARRLTLVYGGGNVGLMGEVADAALGAGGEVIGVIPRLLVEKERAHAGFADLRIVETMHERKAQMSELADAFVALPGGLGTLEELFETWTWAQLGLHRKPFGLLNAEGYWDHLTALLDHALAEGFVDRTNRDRLLVDEDPRRLIDRLAVYEAPPVAAWFAGRG